MRRCLLFLGWVIIAVMGCGFCAHADEPDKGLLNLPEQNDKTSPDLQLLDMPNGTTDQLIQKLEPLSQQEGAVSKTSYQLGLAYAQKGEIDKAVAALQAAVKLDPHNSLAWHNLAANLADLREYDDALKASQTATQVDPQNDFAWNGLANILMRLQRMDEAGAALAEGFKYAPRSRQLWNTLGNYDLNLMRFHQAEESFKTATEIDDSYAIGWCNLGVAQSRQEEFDSALTSFQKALSINARFYPALNNIADAQGRLGHVFPAIDACKRSLAIHYNQPNVWQFLANWDYQLGNWESAVEEFSVPVDQFGVRFPVALAEYGTAAAHVGHFSDADKLLAEAQFLEPQNAEVAVCLGNVLVLETKYPEGEDAYQKALQYNPQSAQAMCGLGVCASIKGKNADAIVWFQKAVDIFPSFLRAWKELAVSQFAAGNRPEALKAFRQAVILSPASADMWKGIATSSDDNAEIEDAATHATTLNPKDPDGFRKLSLIELRLKKYPEAEVACRTGLALDDSNGLDWNNLGLILLGAKKYDDAIAAFEKSNLSSNLAPNAQANNWLGIGFAHLGKLQPEDTAEWAPARDAFEKCTQLEPQNPKWWYLLAKAETMLGHADQAKAANNKLDEVKQGTNFDPAKLPLSPLTAPAATASSPTPATQAPKSPDQQQGTQIEALFQQHQYDQALDLAQKWTASRPSLPATWVVLGQILLAKGRYSEAEDALEKAVGLDPKVSAAWLFLGDSQIQNKEVESAIDSFSKCINLTPAFVPAWTGLSTCYATKKDAPGFKAKAQEILQAHPDSAIGWVFLANVCITTGAKDDALAALQKAADLHCTDVRVVCDGIGLDYARLDDLDKAIEQDHLATQLDPKYCNGWNNLGYALFKQGKIDEAIGNYKTAMDADPKDPRPVYNLTTAYQQLQKWDLAKETWDKLVVLNPQQANELKGNFPASTPGLDSGANQAGAAGALILPPDAKPVSAP